MLCASTTISVSYARDRSQDVPLGTSSTCCSVSPIALRARMDPELHRLRLDLATYLLHIASFGRTHLSYPFCTLCLIARPTRIDAEISSLFPF